MQKYYPLLIEMNKIRCLVIGGGEVALRKVSSLKEYGADITLISPEICAPLAEMAQQGGIRYISRKFQKGDVFGYRLVYDTTGEEEVGMMVSEEAEKEGALINCVDNLSRGNFIVPSKIQRGDLSIAISTNGKSPLLAKRIRQELEEEYGDEYGELLAILGKERQRAIMKIKDREKRKAYFSELVFSDVLNLIKNDQKDVVLQRVEEIWEKYEEE